jgi:hypothetical protein
VEKYGAAKAATNNNMAHALHVLGKRHTQNISHLLLFHDNKGYVNATQCYAACILPVLLYSVLAYMNFNYYEMFLMLMLDRNG